MMNQITLQLLVGVLAVTTIGIISYRKRILDYTGFLSALLVGLIVLFFGGVSWFIILASFLGFASLFTKFQYDQKKSMGVAEEKKGARTWQSVVANGLVVSMSSLGYGLTLSKSYQILFLGAVSTAMADTLATEIGLLSRGDPRLIINPIQHVSKGVSGGVSLLGEVASLLGASLVALISWIINFGSFKVVNMVIIVLVSGFFGSNVDSLLGATIQSAYKCSICGKRTEKTLHCGKKARLTNGIRWIDNNVTNLIATFVGAVTSLTLFTMNIF